MSSRLTRDDARALALELLRGRPDPAVRVRLLRGVLRVSPDDERLRVARVALEDSVHVVMLRDGQRPDGSWGRLHSRDTSLRLPIPTTEWAVERALAVGLDAGHPMLKCAADWLAGVVEGRSVPSDPPERNDRWPTGLSLFAAATLARIDPDRKALDPVWELWHEIARRAFEQGRYDPNAETEAHRELTGASVRGTYLVLCNRYALALLASRASRMDPEVRRAVALWVTQKADGVGYYGIPLSAPRADLSAGELERFLLSHEVVARFGVPAAATGPLADWLGGHRRPDGRWDLGPRASWSGALPLSESWRAPDARSADWTVRILSLLVAWQS